MIRDYNKVSLEICARCGADNPDDAVICAACRAEGAQTVYYKRRCAVCGQSFLIHNADANPRRTICHKIDCQTVLATTTERAAFAAHAARIADAFLLLPFLPATADEQKTFDRAWRQGALCEDASFSDAFNSRPNKAGRIECTTAHSARAAWVSALGFVCGYTLRLTQQKAQAA